MKIKQCIGIVLVIGIVLSSIGCIDQFYPKVYLTRDFYQYNCDNNKPEQIFLEGSFCILYCDTYDKVYDSGYFNRIIYR